MTLRPVFRCDYYVCPAEKQVDSPAVGPEGWYRVFCGADGLLDFCSLDHVIAFIRGALEAGEITTVITVNPTAFGSIAATDKTAAPSGEAE